MLVATGEKSKIWFESLKAFRGVQQACLLLYGLGAMLYDILTLARPDRRRGACYVCFEGGDSLPKGAYGTSLKLSLCMDPVRGIMLAYKQNGEMLHPDHGRPIRLLVPGMIGGRSVKWLKNNCHLRSAGHKLLP